MAWFQIYCDRWIIDYFLGASVVAKFNVMYQIGFTPASLAIGLMSGIFSPLIYQSKDQKDLVNSRNIFPKLIVAAFAMVICLSLITFFP